MGGRLDFELLCSKCVAKFARNPATKSARNRITLRTENISHSSLSAQNTPLYKNEEEV